MLETNQPRVLRHKVHCTVGKAVILLGTPPVREEFVKRFGPTLIDSPLHCWVLYVGEGYVVKRELLCS